MVKAPKSLIFGIDESGFISAIGPNTKDWYAWNNLMPPKPDSFHVTGWVEVPNPGVEPYLLYKSPQGPNPSIIFLDLILVQLPGVWPQILVWKQVRYDEIPSYRNYDLAEIYSDNNVIEQIKVEDIH